MFGVTDVFTLGFWMLASFSECGCCHPDGLLGAKPLELITHLKRAISVRQAASADEVLLTLVDGTAGGETMFARLEQSNRATCL
jgi:hypothetical protein